MKVFEQRSLMAEPKRASLWPELPLGPRAHGCAGGRGRQLDQRGSVYQAFIDCTEAIYGARSSESAPPAQGRCSPRHDGRIDQ